MRLGCRVTSKRPQQLTRTLGQRLGKIRLKSLHKLWLLYHQMLQSKRWEELFNRRHPLRYLNILDGYGMLNRTIGSLIRTTNQVSETFVNRTEVLNS